jgi:hypothetical protein
MAVSCLLFLRCERCCEAAPDISAKGLWRTAFQCLLVPPKGIFSTNADNRHYHCFPKDTENSFSNIGARFGLFLFMDRGFFVIRERFSPFLFTYGGSLQRIHRANPECRARGILRFSSVRNTGTYISKIGCCAVIRVYPAQNTHFASENPGTS